MYVERLKDSRNTIYAVFVAGPKRKKPFGRPRYRWKDNIEMVYKQRGWVEVAWIDLGQDTVERQAVVKTVMNLLVA